MCVTTNAKNRVMKRRSYLLFALFILLVPLVFNVGYSSWHIYASKNYDSSEFVIANLESDSVVCYIDSNVEANRYTSLEVALAKAKSTSGNQTIYVLPGLNKTIPIRINCEIATDDTLVLPYENETYHSYINGSNNYAYLNEANRQTYVQLKENIILTVNGTLTLGGVHNSGQGGQNPNGNTTGKYTEINLLSGAKIINNGTINAYGYISGTLNSSNNGAAHIINNANSVVNMPFSITEHRGGSNFTGMAGKDKNEIQSVVNSSISEDGSKVGEGKPVVFPFNRWLMNNFYNINFSFTSSSKLIGKACLYADGEHNAADLDIINTSGLIQLVNNTSLEGIFIKSSSKLKINIFGSFSLGSLAIKFAIKKSKTFIITITRWIKINISSKDVFLPIPFYFDISLSPFKNGNNAVVNTTNQSFKLLPGSSLTVNNGVTLNAKQIAIYKNTSFYPNGTSIETGALGSIQYPSLSDAIFNNYGSVIANAVGGVINSSNGGTTNISSSSVISKEAHDFTSATITITVKIIWNQNIDVAINIPSYTAVSF